MEAFARLRVLLEDPEQGKELTALYREVADGFAVAASTLSWREALASPRALIQFLPKLESEWLAYFDSYFVGRSPQYFSQFTGSLSAVPNLAQRELAWLSNCALQGTMQQLRSEHFELWRLLVLRTPSHCFSYSEIIDPERKGSGWTHYFTAVESIFREFAEREATLRELEDLYLSIASPMVDAYRTQWRVEVTASAGHHVRRSWEELRKGETVRRFALREEQHVPKSFNGVLSCPLFSEQELDVLSLFALAQQSESFYGQLAARLARVVTAVSAAYLGCFRKPGGGWLVVPEVFAFQQQALLDLHVKQTATRPELQKLLRTQVLQAETEALRHAYDEERYRSLLLEVGERKAIYFRDKTLRNKFLNAALAGSVEARAHRSRCLESANGLRRRYYALGGMPFDLTRYSYLLEDAVVEFAADVDRHLAPAERDRLVAEVHHAVLTEVTASPRVIQFADRLQEVCRVTKVEGRIAFVLREEEQLNELLRSLSEAYSHSLAGLCERFPGTSAIVRLRLEAFIAEALLYLVVAQVEPPSDVDQVGGRAAFGVWLQHSLAERVAQSDLRARFYLLLRKPCLFYAAEDFEVLTARQHQQDTTIPRYIEQVSQSFVTLWGRHFAEDLLMLYNAAVSFCKSPYRDACSESGYNLNTFVDSQYHLSLQQSLQFDAALRQQLIESHASELDRLFCNSSQAPGWFAQALFFGIRQADPLVWRRLAADMLESEYEKLEEERQKFLARRSDPAAVYSTTEQELAWLRRHDELLLGAAVVLREPQAVSG